jgi:hypothetical protein
MSTNLISVIRVLEMVSSIKDIKQREKVLRKLSAKKSFYDALREIAHNTVHSNIQLEAHHKTQLKKHRRTLIELAVKSKGIRKKKALVVQSGGFLPILIPLVLALLNGAGA